MMESPNRNHRPSQLVRVRQLANSRESRIWLQYVVPETTDGPGPELKEIVQACCECPLNVITDRIDRLSDAYVSYLRESGLQCVLSGPASVKGTAATDALAASVPAAADATAKCSASSVVPSGATATNACAAADTREEGEGEEVEGQIPANANTKAAAGGSAGKAADDAGVVLSVVKYSKRLYYRILLQMLADERKRLIESGASYRVRLASDGSKNPDFTRVVSSDEFQSSLFVCCVEAVVASQGPPPYAQPGGQAPSRPSSAPSSPARALGDSSGAAMTDDVVSLPATPERVRTPADPSTALTPPRHGEVASPLRTRTNEIGARLRVFPAGLKTIGVSAFDLWKAVEPFVKAVQNIPLQSMHVRLPRVIVQHLGRMEEDILEEHAWAADSPLFTTIEKLSSSSLNEVSLPADCPNNGSTGSTGSTGPSDPSKSSQPQLPCSPVVSGQEDGPTLTPPGTNVGVVDIFKTPPRNRRTCAPGVPAATPPSPNKGSSTVVDLFFRKVLLMSATCAQDLCEQLQIPAHIREMVWHCFKMALLKHRNIFRGRHVMQVMLCCIYGVAKVKQLDSNLTSFKRVIRVYKEWCRSMHRDCDAAVQMFRHMHLGRIDGKDYFGDIIAYYNKVFLPSMKEDLWAYKDAEFVAAVQTPKPERNIPSAMSAINQNIVNSPLRARQPAQYTSSPMRRLTPHVTVSPQISGMASPSMTPRTKHLYAYAFGATSPKMNLQHINQAVSPDRARRRPLPDMSLDAPDTTGRSFGSFAPPGDRPKPKRARALYMEPTPHAAATASEAAAGGGGAGGGCDAVLNLLRLSQQHQQQQGISSSSGG
eukprot:Rmarinus@m.21686